MISSNKSKRHENEIIAGMHSSGSRRGVDFIFKVILIGWQAAGKSSIISSYVDDGEFSESYLATIGVDFRLKSVESKQKKFVKLQLWDTAGQERFAALTNAHYKGAHACICVYDITSEKSFSSAETYLSTSVETHGIPAVTTLLVGNKIDLESERKISQQQGINLSKKFACSFLETSALQSDTVQHLFAELVERLVEEQTRNPSTTATAGTNSNHKIQVDPTKQRQINNSSKNDNEKQQNKCSC